LLGGGFRVREWPHRSLGLRQGKRRAKIEMPSACFYAMILPRAGGSDRRAARFRLTFDIERYDPENPAFSPAIRAPARSRRHQYAEKVHHGG